MAKPSTLDAAVLFAALALGGSAAADSFQCGQQVVSEGMTSYVVKQRCGDPDSVERAEVPIIERQSNGTASQLGTRVREFWTYGRGWGKFPARLTVEDGVVTKIELLTNR